MNFSCGPSAGQPLLTSLILYDYVPSKQLEVQVPQGYLIVKQACLIETFSQLGAICCFYALLWFSYYGNQLSTRRKQLSTREKQHSMPEDQHSTFMECCLPL